MVKGRQYSAYTVHYCSWLTPCPCGNSIAVLATRTKNYAPNVSVVVDKRLVLNLL